MSETDYDIALSFAGEDRPFVRDVAAQLSGTHGLRVFYDEFKSAEMWGEDLYTYLDEVYRKKARYVVIFISRHYVEKRWPNHERKSTQARALEESQPYLLPVRLDDTELPGLPQTIGYVDARREGLDRIVSLIVEKVGGERPTDIPQIDRSPRTPEEEAFLLATRPDGWEYLLFAGRLRRKTDSLEGKHIDFETGFAPVGSRSLDMDEAIALQNSALAQIRVVTDNFNRLFAPDSTERAFGKPGEAGDADRIIHLADRIVGVYEEYMDWAAALRGALVPRRMRRVTDALADHATGPVRQFREFVDTVVTEVDQLPALLREPDSEPRTITLTLVLSIDEAVTERFRDELDRAEHLVDDDFDDEDPTAVARA